jgi:hypothetical protein
MDLFIIMIVIFSAVFAIYYSMKTFRYRRSGDFDWMRFFNAKANISMGIMLLTMGWIQLFSFGAETTGWRIVVGVVFAALGLFNLLAGMRNYKVYKAEVNKK